MLSRIQNPYDTRIIMNARITTLIIGAEALPTPAQISFLGGRGSLIVGRYSIVGG